MGSRHTQVLGTGAGTIKIGPPVGLPVKRDAKKFSRQATGKSKGLVPKPQNRVMAKCSRSYKMRGYALWCKKYNGIKKVRGSSTT